MSEQSSRPLPLINAFQRHPRQWRNFFYVYPVISRRSHGLSIGINLNPDMACNFDCVYCCVDRTQPPRVRKVDMPALEAELRQLTANWRALFDEPEFQHIPEPYRRLNDIAFSGDGEPTASPLFRDAVQVAIAARNDYGLEEAKLVVITDACFLTRPRVVEALELLDANNGEIWAKLDAGTEDYFKQVCRPTHPLRHVLDNILETARARPVVIQSLFLRMHGAPPPAVEIDAYVDQIRALLEGGAQLRLVQVYTVARQTAEAFVSALTADELEEIAGRLRALGVPVEVYP